MLRSERLDPFADQHELSALSKATGKTVLCEKSVDESLLGGVVTQVGDVIYDGSLRGELQSLKARWQG